jgi:uncharacterized RDD family membrane protein YckC
LSTSVNPINPIDYSPADLSSGWKQEVNRRVAAHRKSKPNFAADRELARETRSDPGSRAALAAARVAARYAKAPSYSEMLAGEARAAMLAAEAATRAARAAHAAAQSVLSSLEAAAAAESATEAGQPETGFNAAGAHGLMSPSTYEHEAAGTGDARVEPSAGADGQTYAIRWEPELPVRRPAPAMPRGRQTESLFEASDPFWPEPGQALDREEEFGLIEPAQPIPGNLIEFPRELVATRRVRPRRVEGPLALSARSAQMSIFEVDPGALEMAPETVHAQEAPVATAAWTGPEWSGPECTGPAWIGPKWSGIELDAQPDLRMLPEAAPEARSAPRLKVASANRRALAAVVDGALASGGFLLLAMLVAGRAAALPSLHALEIGCVLVLIAAGALYETLFLSLSRATPGMWYAQMRLCTFEGQEPTRAQRHARLFALLLSVLPMGLGLAWAIFDEEHLAWHDRLSRTYLRRC